MPNDMVNLAGLEREKYIFELQYYRDLVEKANFTNPTEMTYDGEPIEIQFACINRTVAPCELFDHFFRERGRGAHQRKGAYRNHIVPGAWALPGPTP